MFVILPRVTASFYGFNVHAHFITTLRPSLAAITHLLTSFRCFCVCKKKRWTSISPPIGVGRPIILYQDVRSSHFHLYLIFTCQPVKEKNCISHVLEPGLLRPSFDLRLRLQKLTIGLRPLIWDYQIENLRYQRGPHNS